MLITDTTDRLINIKNNSINQQERQNTQSLDYNKFSFQHLLIDLDYRVDFSEPIPKMIERLKHEHRDFESNLVQIEQKSRTNLKQAIEMLSDLGKSILRHAVEEEARIMRVIMQKAEDQSEQSIKVMQEHRQIIEFLDKTVSQLKNFPQEESAKKIKKFVEVSIKHFSEEEEEIVFPLALKADSMYCISMSQKWLVVSESRQVIGRQKRVYAYRHVRVVPDTLWMHLSEGVYSDS